MKSKSQKNPKIHACKTFQYFSFHLQPHEVPEKWKSQSGPRNNTNKNSIDDDTTNISNLKNTNKNANHQSQKKKQPALKIKSREKLDTTLLRLLARLPNSQEPVDASHLLDGKRLRKNGNNGKR